MTRITTTQCIKMWKKWSRDIKQSMLSHVPYEPLRCVYDKGLMNEKESRYFRMRFPNQFGVEDFSQEEIKILSITNDVSYIIHVKRLSQKYLEKWIVNSYHRIFGLKLIDFVAKSKHFKLEQKLDVFYNLGYNSDILDHKDEIIESVKSQRNSKKLLYSLGASIKGLTDLTLKECEELVIQATNFVYRHYDGDGYNMSCVMSNLWYSLAVQKDAGSKRLESIMNIVGALATYKGLVRVHSREERDDRLRQVILNGLVDKAITLDFVKKLHLDHLIPQSSCILQDL